MSDTDRDADDTATTDADRIAIARLILDLRRSGIHDRRILSAIESVPRRLFLSARYHDQAYANRAVPIECGQTISQPTVVAMMTEALSVTPESRVLEIGTGSGYQAAVLARLAAHVFTIERYEQLAMLAKERLEVLRIRNVSVRVGDGGDGWPEEAPFDRIMITAAAEEIPPALFAQLAENGVVVAPVGSRHGIQTLKRYERTADGIVEKTLADVRFVPLITSGGPGE
jgi:protein-L-isoaspartate(D-aspartate) O-methyltransferase